ncbi:MAG TPA: hypothetical protein DHV30_12295 [Balneola sp.]|nr:hypothetical protein [Balneola sp.]
MPLSKLQFRPGINKETTSYSNEGGWFDCDKIRFRAGFPEKIGGWAKKTPNSFLGTTRALHPWQTISLANYLGVGTNIKYYIQYGGAYYDITPLRATTSAGDVTFSATNGSSTIIVTDTSHGAIVGDFVTFSGAASLGGNITAEVLNQEYKIVTVPTANTYTITAREVNPVSRITVDGIYTPVAVTANSSDSGNGGSSTVGAYQLNIGLNTSITGDGWNAGTWGRGTWNSATTPTVESVLRLWTHDNFGEDLIINIFNGGLFYYDSSAGLTNRAVVLSSVAGAVSPPSVAVKVLVSDVDLHVIAFGCDSEDDPGTQDPLLIRFSDQRNALDWKATVDNTAGDLKISSGSKIITAIETKREILVFTDTSIYSMQFVGPPDTFGITIVSEGISIRSPNSAVAIEDNVFWMGSNEFYVYNGAVQKIPCTLKDFVFSDFNSLQSEKVFAGVNSSFSEIWWFYPSADSNEVDKYVIYNYQQQIWYYGSLNRTAWLDRGVNELPISASTDFYLYNHETGDDDGSTDPVTAIPAHIESSQMDIGEGDQFTFISRIIPDITFRNSEIGKKASLILKTRNFPGGNYLQTDPTEVSKTATVPVEQFTNDAFIRLRGRSFALRVESTETGISWRLGSPRIDIRPDGRR